MHEFTREDYEHGMITSDEVEAACPLKINPNEDSGCCDWATFLFSFAGAWVKFFAALPTRQQWSMARRDWKTGNTGYEAAHNARRRLEESNYPARQEQRETRALARSVIAVAQRTAP